MAYALSFNFQAPTGLTDLRVQLFDESNNNVGSAISTGFFERKPGFYFWHYAGFPDGHVGGGEIYSNADSTNALATFSINPQEAENVNVKISTVKKGLAPPSPPRKRDPRPSFNGGSNVNGF